MLPDWTVYRLHLHHWHADLHCFQLSGAATAIDDFARFGKSVFHQLKQHVHKHDISVQNIRQALQRACGLSSFVFVAATSADAAPRRRFEQKFCRF